METSEIMTNPEDGSRQNVGWEGAHYGNPPTHVSMSYFFLCLLPVPLVCMIMKIELRVAKWLKNMEGISTINLGILEETQDQAAICLLSYWEALDSIYECNI